MSRIGVIVLAHGSRGERGKSEIPEVLTRITNGLSSLLSQDAEIIGASLQFNNPDLEEAVGLLIDRGVKEIIIAPYFLFTGRHLTEHLPQDLDKLRKAYPGTTFMVTDNLGLQDYFIELMSRRITDICPDLLPYTASDIDAPGDIEKQSMEIVDKLLPPELEGDIRIVTRRIVHASGDPFIAKSIKFSSSAIQSGIEAILKGCTIYTDVRMVAAGISARLAKSSGCSIICALSETYARNEQEKISTRAAAGIYALKAKLNGSIVAIGNAPTALLALIELVDKGQASPALVLGMPVGFVQASESKAELMKRDIPYITVQGTRGGSALAAASVNALLKLALKL